METTDELQLDWDRVGMLGVDDPIVPVVLQDQSSGDVLFVAWVTPEALELSLAERRAVLWSTSRQELWRKGETSGDVLRLLDVRVNCEQNSLLFVVERSTGGACHVRDDAGDARPSCYYRTLGPGDSLLTR